MGGMLGGGLCGCPGYLTEKRRATDWSRWKFCQYCLPLWRKDWPPKGYRPSHELTGRWPELAPLTDWWWRRFGVSEQLGIRGFGVHDDGIDDIYIFGTTTELHRLDAAGVPRSVQFGTLAELVALLTVGHGR